MSEFDRSEFLDDLLEMKASRSVRQAAEAARRMREQMLYKKLDDYITDSDEKLSIATYVQGGGNQSQRVPGVRRRYESTNGVTEIVVVRCYMVGENMDPSGQHLTYCIHEPDDEVMQTLFTVQSHGQHFMPLSLGMTLEAAEGLAKTLVGLPAATPDTTAAPVS